MLSAKDRKLASLLLNGRHLTREQIDECVGIQKRLEEPRSLASIVVARRYKTVDELKTIMSEALRAHATGTFVGQSRQLQAARAQAAAQLESRRGAVGTLTAPPEEGTSPFAGTPPPPASAPPPPAAPPPPPPSFDASAKPPTKPDGTPDYGPNYEQDVELARLLIARKVVTDTQARECVALLQRLLPERPAARLTQVILKRRYASREALRDVLREHEEIRARNGKGRTRSATPPPTGVMPTSPSDLPPLPQSTRGPGPNSPNGAKPGGFFSSSIPERSDAGGANDVTLPLSHSAPNDMTLPLSPPASPPSGLARPAPMPTGSPFGNGASTPGGPLSGGLLSGGPLPGGPLSSDPFASVRPQKDRGGPAPEPEAPLRFGSGAEFATPSSANAGPGSGSHPFGQAASTPGASNAGPDFGGNFGGDNERTMLKRIGDDAGGPPPGPPGGPPSGAFGAFSSNVGPAPMGSGAHAFPAPPGSGAHAAPFGGMQGSGVTPFQPSGGMPAFGEPIPGPGTQGSGVLGGPFASGTQPFGGGPSASNFGSGGVDLGRDGFKTMDLDEGAEEKTLIGNPGASSGGPPPGFGAPSNPGFGAPSNPGFGAPSNPGFANASGATPFASGAAPFGGAPSAPSFGAPSSSAAGSFGGPTPNFKTMDLAADSDSGGSESDFGLAAPSAPSTPAKTPKKTRKNPVDTDVQASRSRGASRKTRAQRSSAGADRRSRANVPAAGVTKSLLTRETGLIAAGILVILMGGLYAVYKFKVIRDQKNIRNDVKIARAEDNLEQVLVLLQKLQEYDPGNSELKDELAKVETEVLARRARKESDSLIQQAADAETAEQALKLAEKAVSTDEKNAAARVALGRARLDMARSLRRAGKLEDAKTELNSARDSLRTALSQDGSNQMAYYLLAETLRELGRPLPEQKANYNRAYTCQQTSAIGLVSNARLREIEGREELAIKQYEEALRRKPLREGYLAVAELLRRKREFAKALSNVERLLEKWKDDSEAIALRAHIRIDQDDWDGARGDITKAISLDKGNAFLFGLRAHMHLEDQKWDAAEADCEKAISLDKRCYYPYMIRGQIRLLHKKDKIGAGSDFGIAVSHAPRIAECFYWRGRVLQETNDKEGALRAYDRAVLLDDKNPRVYANRGTVRRQLKNLDGAFKDLEKAVNLDPKNSKILLQRARLVWVQLKTDKIPYHAQQWSRVLNDLADAIANAPEDPEMHGAYGRRAFLYRRRDKRLEAEADYERAIELGAKDIPDLSWNWHGQRGLFYFDEKRWEDAKADFLAYQKKAPSTHQLYENIRRKLDRCRQEIDKRESK